MANVADGASGTDAVNVRQMQAQSVATLNQANAYTDQRVSEIVAVPMQAIEDLRGQVDDQFRQTDRVALVTVPYGGMKSDFTLDRDRFLAALDTLTGRAPQTESASDAGCRSRSTLVALAGTLDSIASADAPPSRRQRIQRCDTVVASTSRPCSTAICR